MVRLDVLSIVLIVLVGIVAYVLGYGLGYRNGNRPFRVVGVFTLNFDDMDKEFMDISWCRDLDEWENASYISFKLQKKGEITDGKNQSEDKPD